MEVGRARHGAADVEAGPPGAGPMGREALRFVCVRIYVHIYIYIYTHTLIYCYPFIYLWRLFGRTYA